MYTKKLIKANLTVGSLLGMMGMIVLLFMFFRYITFQDLKQEIDGFINDHGSLTQEDIEKLDTFEPSFIAMLGGAIGFGAVYFMQISMMSLQMNVTRKHLYRATVISQSIFSVFIVAVCFAVQAVSGLIFSSLCSGGYGVLSQKYKDSMFTIPISGKTSVDSIELLAVTIILVFGAAVAGSLLTQVFTRYHGGSRVFWLTLPTGIFLAAALVLGLLGQKLLLMILVLMTVVLMVYAQWRMIKAQSLENMPGRAVAK